MNLKGASNGLDGSLACGLAPSQAASRAHALHCKISASLRRSVAYASTSQTCGPKLSSLQQLLRHQNVQGSSEISTAWLFPGRNTHGPSTHSNMSLTSASLAAFMAFWLATDPAWALPGLATPVPLQILGFFLNHPVITLITAALAIWAIPRLARAAVRFILVPAALLGVGFLIVTNPRTSFTFAGTALSYVSGHPVITSAVILVGLSFVLSPYILAAGASVLLIGGYKVLPAQLRFLVPAPVVEVDKQLTGVRQRLFKSGQEMKREAPAVKADPVDIFGRVKNIITSR